MYLSGTDYIPIYYKGYEESTYTRADYTLDLNSGSKIRDNYSKAGKDIYVYANYYNNDIRYRRPYFYLAKAADLAEALADSYWADEFNGENIADAIDNKEDIEENYNKRDENNVVINTAALSYAYTFVGADEEIAKVGETIYGSINKAITAIENGETGENKTVVLLRDHNEDVVVPENLKITLDINGHILSGISKSIITVESGADLTIIDGSLNKTGSIMNGRGTPMYFSGETHNKESTILYYYGGAIYNKGALTIKNLKIEKNFAYYGSAIYCDPDYNTSLKIYDSVISENFHQNDLYRSENVNSYAIYARSTSVTMENSELRNNTRQGIYIFNANEENTMYFKNCKFNYNAGVGFYIAGNCNFDFKKCEFNNNSGNGFYATASVKINLNFVDCEFCRNSDNGMYSYNNTTTKFNNCKAEENSNDG